eukprot:202746_1
MAEQKQNGFIEWKITGNLLEQFKNAKHKQVFKSPQFETIDGSIWKIRFYPHGDTSPDGCDIFLECVKLNVSKQQMSVCYSFSVTEMDWCYDGSQFFNRDSPTWGPAETFKAETLNNLQRLTIECFVS